MGRFISEFGMHAAPVRETLRRAIPEDQLYHHSPSMDHHNKDDPKNKGDDLMLTVTGLPGDLDEYVDFSMISQAEGLKFALEHFRRRKPHCSGTLLWQLNDCLPPRLVLAGDVPEEPALLRGHQGPAARAGGAGARGRAGRGR